MDKREAWLKTIEEEERRLAPELQRLKRIIEEYREQRLTLKKQLEKEIVREEFSSDGLTIHRGYYCPSPVQDIIVGGCKRGRLLKRMAANSKPTYKYGFNAEGELILVYSGGAVELIIRKAQTETGLFLMDRALDITSITECAFRSDGKIASYTHAFCVPLGTKYHIMIYPHTYKEEIYSYSEEGLLEAVDTYWSYRRQRYFFQHDDEGYLSSFTFVGLDSNGEIEYEDDRVREIKLKRKV